MENIYSSEFQMPYDKSDVLNWIMRHHKHNIGNPTETDEAWLSLVEKGETVKLPDIVNYNLTPSIWFDQVKNSTSFRDDQIYVWIEEHYDLTVFNKWTHWMATATRDFLNGDRDEWPECIKTWVGELEEHYRSRVPKEWGGDIPTILIKNSPTRKVTFGVKDPDFKRLPNLYSPTKQADKEFISELQTGAYDA